jgi:hypothetical protein
MLRLVPPTTCSLRIVSEGTYQITPNDLRESPATAFAVCKGRWRERGGVGNRDRAT